MTDRGLAATGRIRDFGWLGELVVILAGLCLAYLAAVWTVDDAVYGHYRLVESAGPDAVPFFGWLPFWRSVNLALLILGSSLLVAAILYWRRVDVPLVALFVFAHFARAGIIPLGGGLLWHLYIAHGLVWLLLLWRAARHGDFPVAWSPLYIWLLAIVLVINLNYFTYNNPAYLFGNYLRRLPNFVTILLIVNMLRTRRQFERFFDLILVAALVSALWGIGQFIASELTGNFYTYAPRDARQVSTPWGMKVRVSGFFRHSNNLSQAVGSLLSVLFYRSLLSDDVIPRWKRRLYFWSCFPLGLALIFSFSRSGWLATALVVAIVPIVRWPRIILPYALGCFVLAAVGAATGAIQTFVGTIADFNASSVDFRWHMNHVAMASIGAHPWMGIGLDRLGDWYNPWNVPVHNTYLETLSDFGVIGFCVFGGMLLSLVLRAIRVGREAPNPADRHRTIAMLLAVLVMLLQCQFTMFLWVPYLWFWFAVVEASILVSSRQEEVPQKDLLILRD